MKHKLTEFILILSTIACAAQSALISSPVAIAAPVPYPIHIRPQEMVVVGKLNVRLEPSGEIVSYRLVGDVVYVYEIDNGWCRITPKDNAPLWMACHWLEVK